LARWLNVSTQENLPMCSKKHSRLPALLVVVTAVVSLAVKIVSLALKLKELFDQ
jgi:hypothetical protein